MRRIEQNNRSRFWKGLAIFLLLLFFIGYASNTVVDSGSIGIRVTKWSSDANLRGGVRGTCRGWVCFCPIKQKIFEYPTYIQHKTYEPFRANAQDASELTIELMIAYRLDPDKAATVFAKHRKPLAEIEDGYIRTCICEAYRACANRYASDYLLSHRGEFESDVRKLLETRLSAEGFIIEELTSQITPSRSSDRQNDIDKREGKLPDCSQDEAPPEVHTEK